MSAILKAEGLCGGYGRKTVIEDLALDIERGEFLGIIGPNGSGKSTLLKLLTRVLRPFKGNVFFEGKDIHHIDLKYFTRKVGFVSQDTATSFPFSAMVTPPALPSRSRTVLAASMVRLSLAPRVPENRYLPSLRASTHTGSSAVSSTRTAALGLDAEAPATETGGRVPPGPGAGAPCGPGGACCSVEGAGAPDGG